LLPWLDDLFIHHPKLANGRFYWAISPACRVPRTTTGNIPVGLPGDAAYFGSRTGSAVASALAVPEEVGKITDVDQWRAATLLHLLACENLTLISVWSPTFLSELLRHACNNRQELAEAIAHGGETAKKTSFSAHQRSQRAQLIESSLGKSNPDYQVIWPELQVISCWDQAAAARHANVLREQFPNVLIQGKGLLATEGVVTIPLDGFDYPVLALESGFFEFRDVNGKIFLADQLLKDAEYQLIMTTSSGLYRYAIGDEVRVRGFAMKTPMLEFIGRNNTTSDLCGEKLSDTFVMNKLNKLAQPFAMLAPDTAQDADICRYVLLLDQIGKTETEAWQLADVLEQSLLDNPQYAYARQIEQMAPVMPILCDCPLETWLKSRLACGQRLGDIKVPALLTTTQWKTWVRQAGGERQ
jgi:GH3 auxin-responsive promoter